MTFQSLSLGWNLDVNLRCAPTLLGGNPAAPDQTGRLAARRQACQGQDGWRNRTAGQGADWEGARPATPGAHGVDVARSSIVGQELHAH